METVWRRPLLKHHCTTVHKVKFIKTQLDEFGVQELQWPPQNQELSPAEHVWDILEYQL